MKKHGFGEGKWNGVGGKAQAGENPKQAAIRETQEEIQVEPNNLEMVAILNFTFPHKPEWNQVCHVFLVTDWTGEPEETEEMRPQWFRVSELPFAQMWSDDPLWLPRVLQGEKLEADFTFDEQDQILQHSVREVAEVNY